MRYSTDNLLIAVQRDFADRLRANGYDLRWHTTQEVEARTAVGSAKDIVTFVPEFPPNPAHLIRSAGLNDGSTPQEGEILVPAFAISMPQLPRKIKRAGLGDSTFERWRTVFITGFAYDEFQQREFTDILYEWLEVGDTRLTVTDYTDPDNPVTLEPLTVVGAEVSKEEWPSEIDAIRYYVSGKLILSYFE
jgi:hypothetical protein